MQVAKSGIINRKSAARKFLEFQKKFNCPNQFPVVKV